MEPVGIPGKCSKAWTLSQPSDIHWLRGAAAPVATFPARVKHLPLAQCRCNDVVLIANADAFVVANGDGSEAVAVLVTR